MSEISRPSWEKTVYKSQLRRVVAQQQIKIFKFRKKFLKVHKLYFEKHKKCHIWPRVLLKHLDDNLNPIDYIAWRQISKLLFTLIFPRMLKQLMENVEDLENLDKLLDSSNKSYRDSKSKKSSLEINFLFRYGQFGSGTVFFATPCTYTLFLL